MACYVYGKKIDDTHLWPSNTKVDKPRWHGQGPICLRCGVQLGTIQMEEAAERHVDRTGHHLGTGACEEACGVDKDWWELEPMT